ncbi:MAG: HD domain-containing protein [bacterium]|nr:HD domain-containing protein [bacterium]
MELELQSQLALDSTTLEIVILDQDWKVADINRCCLDMTGLVKYSILGEAATNLWDEESLQKLQHEISNHHAFQGELREISSRGEPRQVHYNFSPMVDENHQTQGYIGIGRQVVEIDHYERELKRRLEELRQTQGAAMVGLAKLAETRDTETGQHLERMRNYSRLIAEELSTLPEYNLYITEDYILDIYNSSPLHDIGKVGIPDAILLKPGRLTPQEFELMKHHSVIGGDALRAADQQLGGESFLTLGKEIAYHHHEKWNGSGYPYGLKGTDIPLSARIVALADVYDALTSKRVYKDPVSHDQARAIIIDSSGSHFADDVVRIFLKRENDFLKIRTDFND